MSSKLPYYDFSMPDCAPESKSLHLSVMYRKAKAMMHTKGGVDPLEVFKNTYYKNTLQEKRHIYTVFRTLYLNTQCGMTIGQ